MAKNLRSVGTFLTNHPGTNPLLLFHVVSLTRCLNLGETTLNVSKLKATNKEQKFFLYKYKGKRFKGHRQAQVFAGVQAIGVIFFNTEITIS